MLCCRIQTLTVSRAAQTLMLVVTRPPVTLPIQLTALTVPTMLSRAQLLAVMLPGMTLLLATWTPLLALAVVPAGQGLSLRQQGWKGTCSTAGLGQWPWPKQLSSLSASSAANSLSLRQALQAETSLLRTLLRHSQHTPLTLSKQQSHSLKFGVRLPTQARTCCLAHRLLLSQAVQTCCTACRSVSRRLSLQCSTAGSQQRSMCPTARLPSLAILVKCCPGRCNPLLRLRYSPYLLHMDILKATFGAYGLHCVSQTTCGVTVAFECLKMQCQ